MVIYRERVSTLRIFDIENPVWSTLSKLLDVMILNVLFLLCCLPIVTISTSFTALYYTSMRMVSGNVTYVSKDFFKSFKENFKQAFVTGVIVFDIGVMLAVFIYLSFLLDAYVGKVVSIVSALLVSAAISYTFPALAKFNTTTSKLFYNSFAMAVLHIPFTILNLGTFFIAGLAAYMSFGFRLILLVFGCAAIALLQSVWFNYIFAKYMTKEELEQNQLYREEERMAKKEKKAKEQKVKR